MKTVYFSRMVIGECISDPQVKEFCEMAESNGIGEQPGFVSSELLTELDGRMVIQVSTWKTREDCFRYHSSRSYRQFVTATQHLLVGNFVVKLFENRATVGAL